MTFEPWFRSSCTTTMVQSEARSSSTDTVSESRTRSSSTASTTSSTDTVIRRPRTPPLATNTWQATLPFRPKPATNPELDPNLLLQPNNNQQNPTTSLRVGLTPAEQNQKIIHLTTFTLKFLTTPTSVLIAALRDVFPPPHFYYLAISLPSQPDHETPPIYRHPIPNFPLWNPPRGYGSPQSFIPEEVLNRDEGNRVPNRWSPGNNVHGRYNQIDGFRAEQGFWRENIGVGCYGGEGRSERPKDWRVVLVGRDRLGDIYSFLLPMRQIQTAERFFVEKNGVLMKRLKEILHCDVEEEDSRATPLAKGREEPRGRTEEEEIDRLMMLAEGMVLRFLEGPERELRVERRRIEEKIDELKMLAEGLVGERGWAGDMVGDWQSLRWFALWGLGLS